MVVRGVGDQNGDGCPDLFVGEDEKSHLDGWVLSGKDGSTLRAFRCLWETGSLAEVLDVPDVDGDGKREVLVCGRPYDEGEKTELRLFSGGSLERLWRAYVPRPAKGHSIGLVHDVDGDGIEDIGLLRHAGAFGQLELTLVGTKAGAVVQTFTCELIHESGRCGFLECPDLDGDGKREFAFLEEGAKQAPAVLRVWSPSREEFLWRHQQPGRWTSSLGALALLGDVNGDGVVDLAATFLDQVRVVSGKTGEALYWLFILPHDDSNTGFGACVLPIGDANGDGVCDVVLSEPDDFPSGNLRAYSGKDGMQLWAKSPPFEAEVYRFGYDLALAGDVDGDGITDLVAGSWEGSAGVPGYAALLSGKSGVPLLEFRRSASRVVAMKPDPTMSWKPVR